jgi:hypothetical protein
VALQPTLLIGVGGSGSKALRTLRQTLLRRLQQNGWDRPELPRAWQLLAIDTVTEQSRDGYPAPLLPSASYLGLVAPMATYGDIIGGMISRVAPDAQKTAFGGWLPRSIPGDVRYGAGQNRAVGRAVAAANLGRIREHLAQAHQEARRAEASSELEYAARLLGADGTSDTVMSVVISSLAGGTGSGMFLDVVEALKAVDHELGTQAQVVLFGPDVFGPLIANGSGTNIAANTLAAVAEITAGVWGRRPSEGTLRLYDHGGMASAVAGVEGAAPPIGSRYNYIIGAVNANGVPIGTMDDAYRAAGDSLAALVADEKVLDGFNLFFRTNVFNNSFQANISGDASGLTTVNEAQFTNPFASFGSARVSLGMDRFIEYASQAITRSVVERLLWPRFHDDPDDERPDTAKVSDRAAVLWAEFLTDSGLDERGTRDQVIEALKPEGLASEVSRFAGSIIDDAAQGIDAAGQPPATWLARIHAGFNQRLEPYRLDRQNDVQTQAARFAGAAVDSLEGLVSQFAARDGLAVAVELIGKLREEIRFVGTEELPVEAEAATHRLDELGGRLSTQLEIGLAKLPANHPAIAAARETLATAAEHLLEGPIRRRIAAQLLLAIEGEVLAPLQDALRQGRDALALDVDRARSGDGIPNPYPDYPRLGEPAGQRFEPGPTEFLLIPTSEYLDQLEDVLQHTYVEAFKQSWQQRTIERVILNVPLGDDGANDKPRLVDVRASWMPTDPTFRWQSNASPQRAAFKVPGRVDHFLATTATLLRDQDTAVGRFIGQSLEEFLGAKDVKAREARETLFVNSLLAAFNASAPLADVHVGFVPQLHPGATLGTHKVLSPIPVDATSPLHDRIRNALTAANFWEANRSPDWFGRSNSPQVDIFQALGVGMSAMAFSSLMRPVTQTWNAVKSNPEAAAAFWDMKRARPLPEAIPISYHRADAMVLGWVISGLLGLRRDDVRGTGGRHVELFDVDTKNWAAFPFPLLDRQAHGMQVLPAVLKSVLLAMAEANAEGSVAPLLPFRLLAAQGGELESEEGLLARWVLHGEHPAGAPSPDPEMAGSSVGSVEERRAATLGQLRRTMEQYELHFSRLDATPDIFVRDRAWELRRWIADAYARVISATESFEDAAGFNF